MRGVSMPSHGGSSPHVRGAQLVQLGAGRAGGIIPACAGSTGQIIDCGLQSRDHPRMCGEHIAVSTLLSNPVGSSPHVRGAPVW